MPEELDEAIDRAHIQELRAGVKQLGEIMDRALEGYEGFGPAGAPLLDGSGELLVVVGDRGGCEHRVSIKIEGLPGDLR